MALMLLHAVDIKDIHSLSEVESELGISRKGVSSVFPILSVIASIQSRRFIFETESGKFGVAWRPLSSGDMIVYVPGGHCQLIVSANGRALMDILSREENDWRMFFVV